MRVLLAPDSFKGSLPAAEVARALAAAWRSVRPGDELVLAPQADGGEGTLDAIEAATGGIRHRVEGVAGPDGRPVVGEWLEQPGGIAVVELAQMAGLPLLGAPDPMGATTRGLGQTIAAALDAGMLELVVGLGGSASTDGALGALRALGLAAVDATGADVPEGGAGLAALASVRTDRLLPVPRGMTLLTDVTAPLTGPQGAAAVFAPQKGATPSQVAELDAGLARLAALLGGDPAQPGSGAAGGAGYGFAAAYGARIVSGADRVRALTGAHAALTSADLVLTGEGRFDRQSLDGKVVGRLLDAARTARVPVAVVAGQVAVDAADSAAWTVSLTELAGSVEQALADPVAHLTEAGRRAATALGR